MNDYEEYEVNCEKVRKTNQALLTEFEQWLTSSGLSARTISNHITNVDLYINDYLFYEDVLEAQDGYCSGDVNMFFGYWFIKKGTWVSQSSMKNSATSLKKFYTFLLEKDLVNQDELQELKDTIKDNMGDWLDTLERYDNPLKDMDDVWQF